MILGVEILDPEGCPAIVCSMDGAGAIIVCEVDDEETVYDGPTWAYPEVCRVEDGTWCT